MAVQNLITLPNGDFTVQLQVDFSTLPFNTSQLSTPLDGLPVSGSQYIFDSRTIQQVQGNLPPIKSMSFSIDIGYNKAGSAPTVFQGGALYVIVQGSNQMYVFGSNFTPASGETISPDTRFWGCVVSGCVPILGMQPTTITFMKQTDEDAAVRGVLIANLNTFDLPAFTSCGNVTI